MKQVPRISDTEWEVMRVLWQHEPATATQIFQNLQKQDPSWHPKTLRTLLTRLVNKGAVTYESEGRTHVYASAVSEGDCVADATESFVDRVFGGAMKPMLSHFVERRKLGEKELNELRDILARRDRDGRNRSDK
jgi:BlaI family penicillinase repressor